MDENVGKIYCLDRGNDDALAAAILANGNRRDYDPMAYAAVTMGAETVVVAN